MTTLQSIACASYLFRKSVSLQKFYREHKRCCLSYFPSLTALKDKFSGKNELSLNQNFYWILLIKGGKPFYQNGLCRLEEVNLNQSVKSNDFRLKQLTPKI